MNDVKLSVKQRELLGAICDEHMKGFPATVAKEDETVAEGLADLGLVSSYNSTRCKLWTPTATGRVKNLTSGR